MGRHSVWRPETGASVLRARVARCRELVEQIVAKDVMAEHAHLFVRVGPSDSPEALLRVFKGGTRRVVRQESPHPCDHAMARSPMCLAAGVGDSWGSTARRYVERRWAVVAS
jgi:putative transposase